MSSLSPTLAQKILEGLDAAVLVFDANLLIIGANKAFYKHFNYLPGNIIGEYINDLADSPWNTGELYHFAETLLATNTQLGNIEITTTHGEKLLLSGFPIEGESSYTLVFRSFAGSVTQQDAVESRQLRETIAQQALIIRHMQDAVISIDLEGNITGWNNGAHRIFGYSRPEVLGRSISAIAPPERHDFLQHEIIKPLLERGQLEIEYKLRRRSGEEFYLHLSGFLLRNLAGDATGILGYITDLTAYKHAENELRQQKELLQTIVDNIPVMILYTNQGVSEWANREWTRALGWTIEDTRDINFISKMHPDQLDQERAIRFALESPEGWHEFTTITKHGQVVNTEWIAIRLSDGGQINMGLDITQRKQVEKEMTLRYLQQEALAILSQDALENPDLQALMDEAVTLIASVLEASHVKVFELMPDNKTLLLKAGIGWKPGYIGTATIGATSDTLAGYTLLMNKPVITVDIAQESRFSSHFLLREHGIVSGISVVIMGQERVFGVLTAHTTKPRTFTANDTYFMQAVANVLATSIRQQRAYQTVIESEVRQKGLLIEMQALTRRLVDTDEAERRKLGIELHDQVGQSLTALNLNLAFLRNKLSPDRSFDDLLPRIQDSQRLVEETVEWVRNAMYSLRPVILDDYGLNAALRWVAQQISDRAGISISVSANDKEIAESNLPKRTELVLFRVTQEALNNVIKHASASHVNILVNVTDAKVVLQIIDNGVGFDTEQKSSENAPRGLGVVGMRERIEAINGTLNIISTPSQGTQVIVEVMR